MTLLKNCSRNFNLSINKPLVNGDFLHYTDTKKFLKKFSSLKLLVQFWNSPWVTLFKNCSWKFDPWISMALVVGSILHYKDMKKFLKNLLRNCWLEFGIIAQDCSLCDPFQNLFAKFWSAKKRCRRGGGGFLHCVDFREIFQNSSPLTLVRSSNNFMEMFLGWPFSKIVCKLLICQMGATCTVQTDRNSCKFFFESDKKKLAMII